MAEKSEQTLSLAGSEVRAGDGTKAKNRGEEDKSSKGTNHGATRKGVRKST